MKEGLKYKFLDELKALPFVEAIYLYGSRARGDGSPRSDIDIAVLCPAASAADWRKVLEIIEEADTLLEIDCVRFDALGDGDRLRESILRNKRVLYQKGADRDGP